MMQTDPRLMEVFSVCTGIDLNMMNQANQNAAQSPEMREEQERMRRNEEEKRRKEQEEADKAAEEERKRKEEEEKINSCLLYTSPSPRD